MHLRPGLRPADEAPEHKAGELHGAGARESCFTGMGLPVLVAVQSAFETVSGRLEVADDIEPDEASISQLRVRIADVARVAFDPENCSAVRVPAGCDPYSGVPRLAHR